MIVGSVFSNFNHQTSFTLPLTVLLTVHVARASAVQPAVIFSENLFIFMKYDEKPSFFLLSLEVESTMKFFTVQGKQGNFSLIRVHSDY